MIDPKPHALRGDVKIPTYKPHTNHKKPSVSSHTLAPITICDFSHSVCGSPLTDLGHISSVTYVCHPLWFVCGHRKGILTSPLILYEYCCWVWAAAANRFWRLIILIFYYPPEVRRGEYWWLGVFLLQYFPLVKIWKLLHYDCINMNIVG